MSARFVPAANLDGVLRGLPAVHDQRVEVAVKIRDRVRQTAAMNRRTPARYGPVEVLESGDDVRTAAMGPFAHLDEWGSANNPPQSSMRSAASSFGRFVPG